MTETFDPRRAAEAYARDGVVSGVPVISTAEAAEHRAHLEEVESRFGSLHYIDKANTALPTAYELATHPRVLDVVEAIIGPDILLYNATYIIKEPGSATKVNWHQDLTYWGLADHDAQVSLWLALAPATQESGCMIMLPGSHVHGRVEHRTGTQDGNLLLLGQEISDVDETGAVPCPLEPGEASFHHGWTIHSSQPNVSADRRIGLNVQYVAPHNSMADAVDQGVMLVRGEDRYGNFMPEEPPGATLDDAAVERWMRAAAQMKANFQQH